MNQPIDLQTCVHTCCKKCGTMYCGIPDRCAYLHADKCLSSEVRCDKWTARRPTDLERAQWWRDGWDRVYNQAADADRMIGRMERGEWYAAMRYERCLLADMARQVKRAEGKVLNTSREDGTCQA